MSLVIAAGISCSGTDSAVSRSLSVGAAIDPDVGDHTDEILLDLGYDDEEIERLHNQGVV